MRIQRRAHSDRMIAAVSLAVAFICLVPIRAQADDCSSIRSELKHSRRVIVPAGTYVCSSPLVLDHDGLDFRGAGAGKTVFKLADHANAPVIIIGHATGRDGAPPATVHDIHASGFSVDGNRKKQDYECWGGPCYSTTRAYIHNNAVTIRAASHVELDHVDLENNRSGGLVTEVGCDHLNVHNIKSSGNFYDGIALYETTRSSFSKMVLVKNHGAGISIDLKLDHDIFKDSVIRDNHDVGIFARDAWENTFQNIRIQNNGNHGLFGAWYGPNTQDTCFRDNTLIDLQIDGNKGNPIRIVGMCGGNKVLDTRWSGNISDRVVSDDKILVVNSGADPSKPCASIQTSMPEVGPAISPYLQAISSQLKK